MALSTTGRLTATSDQMAAGSFHSLWGWRPNDLGDEMARLLYARAGYDELLIGPAVLIKFPWVLDEVPCVPMNAP